MKAKLKEYMFVPDAFGTMPVWSLQHPTKHAEDCYMIPVDGIEQLFPDKAKHIKKWVKLFKNFADKLPFTHYEVIIDCTIEWEYHKETKRAYRWITDIAIEEINLINERYDHDVKQLKTKEGVFYGNR